MDALRPFRLNSRKRDLVVTFLCQNIALSLLAETESAKSVKNAALAHENRLLKTIPAEELQPIFQMRDTLLKLAKMMAACQDVKSLAEIERFVHDLTDGRILIIDESDPTAKPAL